MKHCGFPKGNTDPTKEGNCTLLSAEWDLAERVLKNCVSTRVEFSVRAGRYFIPNLERKHSQRYQVEFMTPGKKSYNKITVVCLRGT